MIIYYWRGATGVDALLKENASAVQRLLSGDYSSRQLEKLHGVNSSPIYSFRLNDANRLIFTTYKGCLHVLDRVDNHDYDQCRFLKKGVIKRYMDTLIQDESSLSFVAVAKDHAKPAFSDSSGFTDSMVGLDYYNRQFIRLSAPQEAVLDNVTLPLILNGAAGSGKTYVGLSMLARHLQDHPDAKSLLYVSKQKLLVEEMSTNWANGFSLDTTDRVEFKTYDDVLAPWCEGKQQVGFNYFNAWFDLRKEQPAIPLDSARAFYQELRICSGFSKDDYCALGDRQSAIARSPGRAVFYSVYQDYQNYLMHNGCCDPAFYSFEADASYDLIVVDEAQNLSLSQHRQLAKLAIRGAIVYCMDAHQNLVDVSPVRVLLTLLFGGVFVSMRTLEITYRFSHKVAAALDNVLATKRLIMGGKLDKYEATTMPVAMDAPRGTFCCIPPEDSAQLDWKMLRAETTQFAVVTSCHYIDEAHQIFNTPLIFTPEQIQGQEYHTIVVYKLLSDPQSQDILRKIAPRLRESHASVTVHRAKKGEANNSDAPWIDTWFTACSRAVHSLVIMEEKTCVNQLFLEAINQGLSDIRIEPSMDVSPFESNWQALAEKQRKLGNVIIADKIEHEKMRCLSMASSLKDRCSVTMMASGASLDQHSDSPVHIVSPVNIKQQPLFSKDLSVRLTQLINVKPANLNIKKIKNLIRNPLVDLNYLDDPVSRLSPLMLAARLGYTEIVDCLLNEGARINVNLGDHSEVKETALLFAIKNGHTQVVRRLLLEKTIKRNGVPGDQHFPLHMAVTSPGHYVEMVEALMCPELDPNLARGDGDTPLTLAAKHDARVGVGAYFLLRTTMVPLTHKDPNNKDRNNNPVKPMSMARLTAIFNESLEMADLFATKHIVNVVHILLSHPNIEPGKPDAEGLSPVILAFRHKNMDIAAVLLNDHRALSALVQQMTETPEFFRNEFCTSPMLLIQLISHRKAVWQALKNIQETDGHSNALQVVLDSEGMSEKDQHPLYRVLFKKRPNRDNLFQPPDNVLADTIMVELQGLISAGKQILP